MEKGELLGKGMTAEVYALGKDKVIKLYFERFSKDWVEYEAKIGATVHETGVPSPEVFDIIELDNRKGIIFERIYGKSLLKHIQQDPWKLYAFAQQLAELQFKIHKFSSESLPSQKERFMIRIKSSSAILGKKIDKILQYIDGLPDGSSVCHGDFHFNNIIISENGLIPIDWSNAYKGNPLSDVARTSIMMSSPSKPSGMSDIVLMMSQSPKWLTNWSYLNEYMRLSKVSYENIDEWLLPVAAAKIRDKVPGEEKWLIEIINLRLRQLVT